MPELFLRLPDQYNLSVICPATSVKMMGLAKWCGVNGNAGRSNHTAPPTVERRVPLFRNSTSEDSLWKVCSV